MVVKTNCRTDCLFCTTYFGCAHTFAGNIRSAHGKAVGEATHESTEEKNCKYFTMLGKYLCAMGKQLVHLSACNRTMSKNNRLTILTYIYVLQVHFFENYAFDALIYHSLKNYVIMESHKLS